MPLIVETGTGASDSDSYISLVDARTYADKYGYVLPVDDTEAEIALRNGTIYVDLFESSYAGERTNDDQALSWPRNYAYKCTGRNQTPIDSDHIPVNLMYAQVIAASYYGAGVDVRANNDGNSIASEEVTGAVKVSYFDNGKTGASIEITQTDDMLSTLLCVGNSFTLKTVRT